MKEVQVLNSMLNFCNTALTINKVPRKDLALCSNMAKWVANDLETPFSDILVQSYLDDFFPKWKHYSGVLRFPIPSPKGDRTLPPIYFWNMATRGMLWDRRTKDGQLRWSLLIHVSDCIRKELRKLEC